MRISWRLTAVLVLGAAWPSIGCMQMPAGKSVQEMQPLDTKLYTGPASKQELTAAEIAQAWQKKADTLEQSGKTNDAIAVYEQIRQTDGSQVPAATRKIALLYDRSNDLERAELEYRFLLQQNPKDADILCNLGNVYYRRGLWHGAEKFFSDALYYQPEHKAAWAGLGWTLAQKSCHDKSIECLTKVVSRAEAYRIVASVLNLQGKREDALRMLQTAVEMEPNNVQIRTDLVQMQSSAPIVPQTVMRTPPPIRKDQPGHVVLEDVPSTATMNIGAGRLLQQRPTLPPLPDFDLIQGDGRPWDNSARTSQNK